VQDAWDGARHPNCYFPFSFPISPYIGLTFMHPGFNSIFPKITQNHSRGLQSRDHEVPLCSFTIHDHSLKMRYIAAVHVAMRNGIYFILLCFSPPMTPLPIDLQPILENATAIEKSGRLLPPRKKDESYAAPSLLGQTLAVQAPQRCSSPADDSYYQNDYCHFYQVP
jgi:hypothetical protein